MVFTCRFNHLKNHWHYTHFSINIKHRWLPNLIINTKPSNWTYKGLIMFIDTSNKSCKICDREINSETKFQIQITYLVIWFFYISFLQIQCNFWGIFSFSIRGSLSKICLLLSTHVLTQFLPFRRALKQ